ncbi:MAG: SDR family NAD(P)-dependent oxidoreductase, partial [Pseudomonadota bacterium]
MASDKIEGTTVVISGGSSGIGLCVAERALGLGAKRVVLLARNADRLAAACEGLGDRAHPVVVDVTDEHAVSRAFASIGAFDHLVTAAAGTVRGTIVEVDTAAAKGLFEAKFWGQHHCVKY